MFSSCALHVTRVCSLAAVLRPSAAAATGSAAFGRAGAFGARWHLHWHAIVSSRAVPSRASARSQALDATCVSRKNYVVHGDASFCAERKIPTNIAGIPHRSMQGFREQMPRRPNRPSTDRHINRIQSLNPSLFLKKKGVFRMFEFCVWAIFHTASVGCAMTVA